MSSAAEPRWDRRGFSAADPPPPIDLSHARDVRPEGLARWTDGDTTVTTGCWRSTLASGWPGDDVEATVHAKLVDVASKLGGEPLRVVGAEGRARQLASDHGAGRTFLGFDGRDAVGCVLACTVRQGDKGACAEIAGNASLEGASSLPPPPGVGLSCTLAMVHHPAASLALFLGAVTALGAALVRFRNRPG